MRAVEKILHYTILFTFIPLILSIGIAPALSIENFSQEADAEKAVGPVSGKSYGSRTSSEVCGDHLCSESESTGQASSSSRVTPSTPIPKASAEEVEEESTITQVWFHDKTDEPVKEKSSTNQPNIIVIMADDVGWFNIGVYNQGIMGGTTPNLDKIAANGMRFTDYYAEPSCTAGRANFITGELPMRTGLTTVGQAGSDIGMPAEAPTIATVLKSMGYANGQFGKNHLGDLNKFLPTVHGFDEFFGYLYHLDAMEDPYFHSYPESLNLIVGPRNMVHSWATDVDDPTVDKRWGKVGMQKVEDAGGLPPKRMETVDDEILQHTLNFMDKAQEDEKPFFVWLNPTRVHVITHLSEKYEKLMTPENGWYTQEAAMAHLDDIVGEVVDYLDRNDLTDNTILVFTTDNGAEVFTWPDGGLTPFAGAKGMVLEGGMRVPMIIQWPGHIEAGTIENGLMSGLDFFPTLVAAAGNPNIVEELKKGKTVDGTTYKVHLDGYDQMDLLTGNGPSQRHEIYYFAQSTFGAVRVDDYKYRFIDQPDGWFGSTVQLDSPTITNLRLDPLERAGLPSGYDGSQQYFEDFFIHEFWRNVVAQKQILELAETAVDFPPMQKGASFNLDSVVEKLKAHSVGQ